MCEEVDNKPASSNSEYTTDEEWEEEYRKTKANWEKERVKYLKVILKYFSKFKLTSFKQREINFLKTI